MKKVKKLFFKTFFCLSSWLWSPHGVVRSRVVFHSTQMGLLCDFTSTNQTKVKQGSVIKQRKTSRVLCDSWCQVWFAGIAAYTHTPLVLLCVYDILCPQHKIVTFMYLCVEVHQILTAQCGTVGQTVSRSLWVSWSKAHCSKNYINLCLCLVLALTCFPRSFLFSLINMSWNKSLFKLDTFDSCSKIWMCETQQAQR